MYACSVLEFFVAGRCYNTSKHPSCAVHLPLLLWSVQKRQLLPWIFINPRRACAARVTVVVLSYFLSARVSSRTTGYKAANEWHQRVVNNEKMDIDVAIFLKRLRSRVASGESDTGKLK